MFSASPWLPFLIGACLLALVVLATMSSALAPFLRATYHSGTALQRGAVGGLILLLAAEAGFFGWMALAF
jgi:hypothetical protein